MNGWKKIFHASGNRKRAIDVALFTLDKRDFKPKVVTKDKEGHYRMMQESTDQEDTTIINTYMHPTREHRNILSKCY